MVATPSRPLPHFRGHGVDGRHLAFQSACFGSSLVDVLLLVVFIIVLPKHLCHLMLLFENVASLDRHFYKITFSKMSELLVFHVLLSIKFLDMFVNFSIKKYFSI